MRSRRRDAAATFAVPRRNGSGEVRAFESTCEPDGWSGGGGRQLREDLQRSRRIEIVQEPDGNWRWKHLSQNGRVITKSRGYGSAVVAELRAKKEHPNIPIHTQLPPARHISGKESMIAFVLAVVLSVAMTWPMAARVATHVPANLGDTLFSTYELAWLGHIVKTSPSDVFQANIFQPSRDTFAFSDTLLGLAPLSVVGEGRDAALIRHSVIWILAFVIAAFGAYVLARELDAGRWGAAVAAVAFGFAPFRFAQIIHLNILWSGGIPLSLFALIHGYRRSNAWWVAGGWTIAAWQVSLGWNLGLPFAYLIGVLSVGTVVALALVGRLKSIPSSVKWATAGGAVLFLLVGILMARPYLRVAATDVSSKRAIESVAEYSPPIAGVFAAPEEVHLWGFLTRGNRATLNKPWEQSLFPGLTVIFLAVIGAAFARSARSLRLGLLAGTGAFAVFSLGLRMDGIGGFLPYRLLYEIAPGFKGLRTPGRLMTFVTLGLALLAGLGARRIADRRSAAAIAFAALILVEGLGVPIQTSRAPERPAGLEALDGRSLRLHLPTPDVADLRYVYWTIDDFAPIANGYSGLYPPGFVKLLEVIQEFPDAKSVDELRRYGVRQVVFHPAFARGTAYEQVASRSISALNIVKREVGEVIIFDLPA